MITLVVAGCTAEKELTNKEKYARIMENSQNLDSYAADFEGTMSMDMEMDPAEMAEMEPFMNMFQNIKFGGTMEMKKSDKIADLGMQYNVNMNGLAMMLELYFDGQQLIIDYPMLQQYIVLDLKAIYEMENKSADQAPIVPLSYDELITLMDEVFDDLYPMFSESLVAAIDEEDIEYLESYDFVYDGETQSMSALKVNLDAEAYAAYMLQLMEVFKNSEEVYELVQQIAPEEVTSFEDYQAAIDEAIAEMKADEEGIEMLKEQMGDMVYTMIIGYDKDYQIQLMDADIQMTVTDEYTDMTMTMDMDMSCRYRDHNNIDAVTIPEITDENSMDYNELMEMGM